MERVHVNYFPTQIAHLLEEDFIEPYTDDIRELAGHVNLLAKIVKNDNTKGLGLHLYDEHLKPAP